MVRVLIGTGGKVAIGGAAYKCKKCGMSFGSKKELGAHTSKAHGTRKSRILIHEL